MYRVNGRLQLVGPGPALAQRFGDQSDALSYRRSVPKTPILLRERNQLAVRSRPRRPASVSEQHLR